MLPLGSPHIAGMHVPPALTNACIGRRCGLILQIPQCVHHHTQGAIGERRLEELDDLVAESDLSFTANSGVHWKIDAGPKCVTQTWTAVNVDRDLEIVSMSLFRGSCDFVVCQRLDIDHSSVWVEGAAKTSDISSIFDILRHVCLDQIHAVPGMFANQPAAIGGGIKIGSVLPMRPA